MRVARHRGDRQGGFTLIELSIALVLLLVGLMIAAELLMETSQLFAETAGESLDTPVPLVIARIRGDVQGGIGVSTVLLADGSLDQVVIQGLNQQIVYRRDGDSLDRTVLPQGAPPQGPAVLWRGVTDWSCRTVPGINLAGTGLVELSVTYSQRAVPRSPLPGMPADRGPISRQLTQTMFLLPRGAGLGDTW